MPEQAGHMMAYQMECKKTAKKMAEKMDEVQRQ